MKSIRHVAIVIGSLRMGGAEKAAVNLANEFARRGMRVDMVLVNAEGEFLNKLHADIHLVDLKAGRTRRAGKPFRKYILAHNPQIVIAIQAHVQLMVLMARQKYRLKVPVVLNEQSIFSLNVPANGLKNILFRLFAKRYFPLADGATAVSTATAKDFSICFPELNGKVDVIFNPVLTGDLSEQKFTRPEHSFFQEDTIPVILSAGRLTASKDFAMLIRALTILRKQTPVRLVILGEGEERAKLMQLAESLQMKEDFSLPGFISNPMSWMNYADVFVLSSVYEGLPFVLVEAMAAGCTVVSTDCPGGSSEILGEGRYGRLVEVGNAEAMAETILYSLANKTDKSILQKRAAEFTATRVADDYLELIQKIINQHE